MQLSENSTIAIHRILQWFRLTGRSYWRDSLLELIHVNNKRGVELADINDALEDTDVEYPEDCTSAVDRVNHLLDLLEENYDSCVDEGLPVVYIIFGEPNDR